MAKALDDVTILDLTQVLAGPFALTILADFGANVIQIEPPGGDYGRRLLSSRPIEVKRLSAWNRRRNRKGITLNLKSRKGKDIFLKLVEKADVVVQNFSPGAMDKMGLGYQTLKKANPDIIYCSMSGFGETGPYKNRLAYDPAIQAATGMMAMTGYPENPPVRVGPNIADYGVGVYAVIGILVALHYKLRTGKGQMIDCAMFDSLCHWTISELGLFSKGQTRFGNQHPMGVTDLFVTKDKQNLIFAIQTDEQWDSFLKITGRDDIRKEKWSFNTRLEKYDDCLEICKDWAQRKDLKDAMQELDQIRIVNAEIIDPDQLREDPQVHIREMMNVVNDPEIGVLEGVLGTAPKLSGTPGTIGTAENVPELSQHTEEILAEFLGMSERDIAALREDKII